MKPEYTSSADDPPPSSPIEPPIPPSSKKPKPDPKSTEKKPKHSIIETGGESNGTWDGQKREIVMDRVIAAGYEAMDFHVLAAEVSFFQQFGMGRRLIWDGMIDEVESSAAA